MYPFDSGQLWMCSALKPNATSLLCLTKHGAFTSSSVAPSDL